jgi:hypothetical protein
MSLIHLHVIPFSVIIREAPVLNLRMVATLTKAYSGNPPSGIRLGRYLKRGQCRFLLNLLQLIFHNIIILSDTVIKFRVGKQPKNHLVKKKIGKRRKRCATERSRVLSSGK